MYVKRNILLCMLLVNPIYAMWYSNVKKPEVMTFLDDVKNKPASNLEFNDYLAWHAYAVAVMDNNEELLSTLEKKNVPIPDEDNVTFMMRHYALPYSMLKPDIPLPPKPNALCWCLEHGANPNGFYSPKSIKFFRVSQMRDRAGNPVDDGAHYPLVHIAKFLYQPEMESAFTALKKHNAYLYKSDPSGKEDFTYLIGYTSIQTFGCSDQLPLLMNSEMQQKIDACLRTKIIYQILNAYKEIVPDEKIANYIFNQAELAIQSGYSMEKADIIKKRIFPYITQYQSNKEKSINTEKTKNKITLFKSLFSCGRSAKQVIPQSN